MSIKITETRDGQQYRCIVTDKYNNTVTSDVAAIHVEPQIKITKQPVDVTAPIGDPAKFSVTAEGEGLTYQWQYCKNGEWKNSNSTGYNTSSMSVRVTEARDGQQYRCVITKGTNSVISDVATIHMVKIPLLLLSNPEDYSGPVGETATSQSQ